MKLRTFGRYFILFRGLSSVVGFGLASSSVEGCKKI